MSIHGRAPSQQRAQPHLPRPSSPVVGLNLTAATSYPAASGVWHAVSEHHAHAPCRSRGLDVLRKMISRDLCDAHAARPGERFPLARRLTSRATRLERLLLWWISNTCTEYGLPRCQACQAAGTMQVRHVRACCSDKRSGRVCEILNSTLPANLEVAKLMGAHTIQKRMRLQRELCCSTTRRASSRLAENTS